METTIETKSCKHCSQNFDITDKDMEFYEKISPSFGGKKYPLPSPSLCPDCRNQRRLSWRNEGKLYKRICDATGKEIVSMYAPNTDLIVYDKEYWNSDACDVTKYALEIDTEKSFFEQYEKLLHTTPLPSLTVTYESENSEYAIYSGKMKECYMLFASWGCERTMYSARMISTKVVFDSTDGTNLEKCYQIVNCENCFGSMYLVSSNNCQNCLFSYDLENCQDCIGCYNLVGKQYYINNKSHTKEEYHAALNQIKQSYFKIGWGFIDSILPLAIHKNLMMVNCEDCIGDNLKNCKSCHYCFHFEESENCKYAENGGMGCYNAYDGRGIGENLQFGYEILDTGINAVTNAFLISCYTCNTTFYSINCHNSSNLFGCLGLKNKEYCILNKQYTKEEYETLVPQLIQTMQSLGEWGEFFPSNASLFGYNETAAQEYYPLTKEETVLPVILSNGKESKDPLNIGKGIPPLQSEGQLLKGERFNWSPYESPTPKVEKIIPADKLPENIDDIPDDILNWAIECKETKRPFRIIKPELEFYRKNQIPVPKYHPEVRHLQRVQVNHPKHIYTSNCDKCRKEMYTIFDSDTKNVYCESCYNEVMY